MQCGSDRWGDSKTAKEVSGTLEVTGMLGDTAVNHGESAKRRLSFSSDTSVSKLDQLSISDVSTSPQASAETNDQRSTLALNADEKPKDASPGHSRTNQQHIKTWEDTAMLVTTSAPDNSYEEDTSSQRSQQDSNVTACQQHSHTEASDTEVVRRAQEEGRVNVIFSGTVTQEGCCHFVSEILKFVLYQRQQLPMTYDQLLYSQKKQQTSVQDKDAVSRRPVQLADMNLRKRQQALQELEEMMQQLEVLFCLSRVPRVLLLMGGSLVLPKELYEINMEALALAAGDQSLRVSSCSRQLFRTLFVADLLSDTGPVCLMATTVLVLAHRDCDVGWFRPKLQFKVPTRVKKQIIALSTDPNTSKEPRAECSDWQDYVWFQAPVTIKGFKS